MRGLQPLNQPGRRALSLLLLGLVVFTLVACRRASQVRLTERDETLSLHHADRERSFILHRPTAAASGTARPLLIVMHGGGGDARGIIDITRGRFNELADAENFYVVYPQGVDKSWNDGRVDVRSTAHKENIDDVGFLKQMIETIAANHTIDRTRVFATGISNGGFMSYRLACELSGTVRAVAPVTAQLSKDLLPDCKPNQPVGVLMINGTLDPLVPYDGGTVDRRHAQILGRTQHLRGRTNRYGTTRPRSRRRNPRRSRDVRALRRRSGRIVARARRRSHLARRPAVSHGTPRRESQ